MPGNISFTFEAWTFNPGNPFLSITSHYIHTHTDRPNDWELKTKQLAFTLMQSCHSGANMANLLVCTVDHYSLCNKVSGGFSKSVSYSDHFLSQLVYI
jgi:hypothetical protein